MTMGTMMESPRRKNLIIVAIILLILGGGVLWYTSNQGSYSYHVAAGDTISDWNFQGAYTGNPELEQKAHDEIVRLQGVMGDGVETDYSYYVSIANQYDLLGEGEKEFEYLKKALAIDDTTTGLAWNNVGALFEKLGAYETARDAYARAVEAQDQFFQYQTGYIEFLIKHFPDDSEAIEDAFAKAKEVFGDNATLLALRAKWEEEQGKIKEAIATWQEVKTLKPDLSVQVNAEIARLQNEL